MLMIIYYCKTSATNVVVLNYSLPNTKHVRTNTLLLMHLFILVYIYTFAFQVNTSPGHVNYSTVDFRLSIKKGNLAWEMNKKKKTSDESFAVLRLIADEQ